MTTQVNNPAIANVKEIIRSSGKGLVHPILMIEYPSQSTDLSKLNASIMQVIDDGKRSGALKSASVYLKDMDNDDWISLNDAGYVYVTGVSGGGSTGSADPYDDYATIKYYPSGTSVWVKRYNGTLTTSPDAAIALKLDKRGYIYVTGTSNGAATDGKDYLTIKYNSAGGIEWTARYNGTGSSKDEAKALDVDRMGNVYVTGVSYAGATNGNEITTVKYDSSGVKKWAVSYNGPSSTDDGGESVAVDSFMNVFVTGYSTAATTAFDYATIKYDTGGVLKWSIRYTNGGSAGSSDEPASLKLDKSGNIYVTGMSALDYATVKYSAAAGLNEKIRETNNILHCFPNPVVRNLNIYCDLPVQDKLTLVIFDIYGNTLATLAEDQESTGGINRFQFNVEGFAAGVYYCRLSAGNYSITNKFLIVK